MLLKQTRANAGDLHENIVAYFVYMHKYGFLKENGTYFEKIQRNIKFIKQREIKKITYMS